MIALLAALAALCAAAELDAQGVRALYPSAEGGRTWQWRWDWPARRFYARDPADGWLDGGHGDAVFEADGTGILKVTGPYPRLYAHDPAGKSDWGDVEITAYAMRLDDKDVPYGGIVAAARTNHGATGPEKKSPCDTRGLIGRFRHDGRADFEKETRHPASTASRKVVLWPGGMPKGVWIGQKFVVYDLPKGRVKLELWLDETDGRAGGDWRKVHELVDDGSFGTSEACARGVAASLPLLKGPDRKGSESGRPNAAVYWRSDGVGPGGLLYKRLSVREIDATRAASPEARAPLTSSE